jgi:hypothetical protein
MVRSARKLGVHRLSDFSRTAVYLGRPRGDPLAEGPRGRAYDAALRLDPDDPDAVVAPHLVLARTGRFGEALKSLPSAAVALFATRESRVAILSNRRAVAGAGRRQARSRESC